jgi:hypothetical protein
MAIFGWDSPNGGRRSVVAGGPSLCGHGKHDDDKSEHRQSHEFEYQSIHGNSPQETVRFARKPLNVS